MADTKELVERLRIPWPKFETEEVQIAGWIIELCEEAADAIERLERERDELLNDIRIGCANIERAESELAALRSLTGAKP